MNEESLKLVQEFDVLQQKWIAHIDGLAKEDRLSWNVFIALESKSEANMQEHWAVKHKRVKLQKKLVWAKWMADKPKVKLPCVVCLTRQSTKELDRGDNLEMAMKHIRDQIADLIIPGKAPGQADSSKEITWIYNQTKGRPKGISIQIV